jgi:sugar lactone lactonase YvrE
VTSYSGSIIETVAGNGDYGYSGDGGLAVAAKLSDLSGVYVDGAGRIFIADQGNHRIRMIDTGKNISTVAGNGGYGYSGDGGLAVAAKLRNPKSVYVDGAGRIFIADSDNSRIRMVDSSKIISTVAGNGVSGYSGDGGLAVAAKLYHPTGVYVDGAGRIFIADSGNSRIRMVDIGKIISTVAGNGVSGYSGDGGLAVVAKLSLFHSNPTPQGVYVDGAGRIFIADTYNNRLRRVTGKGQFVPFYEIPKI